MDFTDCNIAFREHFISYHSTSSPGAGVAGLVNSRQSQGQVACAQCLSVTRRLSAAPVKTRPQAPCHLLAELFPRRSRCCGSAAREQTGGNRMLVTPRVGHVEPARGLSTLGGHSPSPHLGRVRAQQTTTGHPQGKPRKTPRED